MKASLSSEYEALARAAVAFRQLKSFRSRVQTAGGILLVDFVAPNRYRIRSLTEEVFVVGKQAFVRSGATYVPSDVPFSDFVIDLATDPRVIPQWARLSPAVFLTTDIVDGVRTRVYRLLETTRDNQAITTVWIAERDHLPRQLTVDSSDAHVLVQYLGFNEPLHFGP